MTPRLRTLLLLLPLLLATLEPSGAAQPVNLSQGLTLPTLTGLPLSARQVAGIGAVLQRQRRVRWGLLITDAQTGTELYARQPNALYTPASNMKLLSLGAVLYTLGPGYWFSTSVTRPARSVGAAASSHTAHLTLVGSGDPSLEASAGRHSLAALARQVYASGIRTVGGLRLDGHLIGAAAGQQEAGWSVPLVERPITGLSLNDPTAGDGAELTTTPDARAAQLKVGQRFRAELRRAGVQVAGELQVLTRPASGPPEEGVATTRSAPLAGLVAAALKRSDNVWTEQLYARLGVNTSTPIWRPASPLQARAQQTALLGRAGIAPAGLVLRDGAPAGLVLRDGSGLSGRNRLTPRALVGLLRYVYLHPPGSGGAALSPQAAFEARTNLLIEALPQAGTGTASLAAARLGGTLATRMAGLDVRAKTGTLPGVSGLSGYLTTQSGRVLIFSVLMDGYSGPGQDLRQLQDALLRALASDS